VNEIATCLIEGLFDDGSIPVGEDADDEEHQNQHRGQGEVVEEA